MQRGLYVTGDAGATVDGKQPLTVELSDEALVERVKQQDVVAFTLLYDRHAPAVYALAAHLLNPTDAEEVVQEVFLRLWRKADQFDCEAGRFKSWFMTIARNHIWDQLKTRQRDERLRNLVEIEERLGEVPDPAAEVTDAAWNRQRKEAMHAALRGLPPEQRRAIVMAYFGGLSQSAIARELGWPLGTVKKRIRLGMQKLRTFLTGWQSNDG